MLTSPHLLDDLKADALHPGPSARHPVHARQSDRQNARISMTGWAQVCRPGTASLVGRMNDLSMTGFSLFMDRPLRLAKDYRVMFNIYRHGRASVFDVPAHCVYAMLVRADGFKHGFEFGVLDAATEDSVRALLA